MVSRSPAGATAPGAAHFLVGRSARRPSLAGGTDWFPPAEQLQSYDPQVAVYAVALRGNDFDEEAVEHIDSIDEIAQRCVQKIVAEVSGDVAVYGHCAGEKLAIARQLELSGRLPQFVCLGATLPGRVSINAPRDTNYRKWRRLVPKVRVAVLPDGGHYFIGRIANLVARLILALHRELNGQEAGDIAVARGDLVNRLDAQAFAIFWRRLFQRLSAVLRHFWEP